MQFTETDLFKSLSEPVQKLLQKSKTSVACDWKLSGDAKVVQNISAINANDKEQLVQELRKNPEIKEIKQAETTVFVQKVKAEGTSNSAAPQQITYVPSDKSMAVLKTPEKGAEQFTKSANDALKIAEGKEVAKPKAEEFKPLVIPTCDNANAAFTERLAKVGPPPVWKVEEQKLNMHPDDAKAMPEMAKAITNGRGCRWPITPRFGYFQTIAEVSLQDKEAIVSNLQAGITKTYSGGSTQSEKITFKETERRGAKVFNSANEDYVLIGNAFIKINYAMGGNTDSVSSDAAVDSALNALFAANPHLKK
ncbi:MAG: hypothetical protein Q4C71_02705 [Microbacteriaceae bacterium]|nr:hypothetical protein [Microbacteriaceae bacterium]